MTETQKQIHHEIADWLGDLVALESHVEEAMDAQLKLEGDAALTAAIQRFHDTVRDSKRRAVAYQEQYGSEAGNPVVKTGSEPARQGSRHGRQNAQRFVDLEGAAR